MYKNKIMGVALQQHS